MVPDEMVADNDVLGLVVFNRIMSNLDGTLFVTQQWHLVKALLSTTTHGRHILGFGGGGRHAILLLGRPTNQKTYQEIGKPRKLTSYPLCRPPNPNPSSQ
jgi:hypothetical protein